MNQPHPQSNLIPQDGIYSDQNFTADGVVIPTAISGTGKNALVLEIADGIRQRRLEVPALFLVELARPWTTFWFASGIAARPIGHLLFGAKRFEEGMALLSDAEAMEQLANELDSTASTASSSNSR